MKIYRGSRLSSAGAADVRVQEDGEPVRILTHRVRHSPDGFQWGYGGSGPADLARSILWDVLGHEPLPSTYQAFKFAHVAGWGDTWEITDVEIRAWLHDLNLEVSR